MFFLVVFPDFQWLVASHFSNKHIKVSVIRNVFFPEHIKEHVLNDSDLNYLLNLRNQYQFFLCLSCY